MPALESVPEQLLREEKKPKEKEEKGNCKKLLMVKGGEAIHMSLLQETQTLQEELHEACLRSVK